MADGTNEFKALDNGGYESTETVGALTITTTYDENFEKTGVSVEKQYDDVKSLTDMSADFQAAWSKASSYLPGSYATAQFATEGGHTVIIATEDFALESVQNGDVIGRISSWDNTGTWTRWLNDQEVDVESQEWNYNFHDADWNSLASAGGREVYLVNLTDDNGNALPNELDETGERVSSTVHKSVVGDAAWATLKENSNLSDAILTELGTTWANVNHVEIQDDTWSAVENSYRNADELWSDGEERLELHGIASDPNNVEFLGSVTKRDGFIVLRDSQWGEVARLIDPSVSSEDTTYDAMVQKFGEAFADMWTSLDGILPNSLANPQELQYVADNGNDILVFDTAGAMVARLNHWEYSNTWDRTWDSDYPTQTHTNANFEVQVRDVANSQWTSLGRYEAGQSDLISASGVTEAEHSWEQTSSTIYERNSSAEDWATLGTEHFSSLVADSLSSISSWDSVDRLEISENSSIFYPVSWRDELETEESTSVRFYEEVSMDNGSWYRSNFLGSMEKRDGFIEVRDENWDTVARVVDLSDSSQVKDWAFITNQYDGLEDAWDNVKTFFPDLENQTTGVWETNPLTDPTNLKFTTDDNNIYAFSAVGVMVGQINFWTNENEWESYRNDTPVTVKNFNYNYNFHDADWNNIANSGGNSRYLVDPEDGDLILDEVGTRIGFNQNKSEVDPSLWATYDPGQGAIDFTTVTEIRYQTNSWNSVTNKYREAEDNWSDSNKQIEYFAPVQGQNWNEFIGSMETRDGFIEIRDENWNVVERKVDGAGQTFNEMVTKYGSGFADAWTKLGSDLPTDFGDGTTLKYATDKWDNILVFKSTGEMIGQINYWSHTDQWDRPWDDEYPSAIHENSNFRFEQMLVTDAATGAWNWVSIGEYQTGTHSIVKPDGTTVILEESWENIGATIYERADATAWGSTVKDAYFVTAVEDALNLTWDSVDRLEVSENNRTFEAVRWRDQQETETSTQVRFYEEIPMNNGDWYHTKFLGSIEKRDGFIEIRNENWETVSRVADTTDPSLLKDWTEIKSLYAGIEEAWDNVTPFFPKLPDYDTVTGNQVGWTDNPLTAPDGLKFTTDDYNIYVFTPSGVMAGQINYWSNQDEYDRYFHFDDNGTRTEVLKTVQNVDYNYNFHDADWNSIANSGGNLRYIVEDATTVPKTLILDEVGSNVGFTQRLADTDPTTWATYDPGLTDGPIDFSKVVEVRYETREWGTVNDPNVVNPYRDAEDQWSDSNVQIQYFEEVDGQNWTKFVGAVEKRDGFIEIRDQYWNVISKKVDGGQTYDQMVADPSGGAEFAAAWTKMSQYLPSEWTAADANLTPAYESFKFSKDQWDNILVFDTAGEMIGQINYWHNEDYWPRDWDTEYVSEKNTNTNFQFQGMQTNANGDWNWVSLGEYRVGQRELLPANDTDYVLEKSWENIGATIYEQDDQTAWDGSVKSTYFVDQIRDTLGFEWESVDRIEASSDVETYEAIRWRDAQEVETSTSVRFYQEVPMDGGNWYHSKFLGSIEKRDGFIEIRDENWNTVAKVGDASSQDDFATIKASHGYLEEAWTKISNYLPDAAKDPNALGFTQDEGNIYAFDTASGEMLLQINFWGGTDTFSDPAPSTFEREEIRFNYQFQDDDYNSYATVRKYESFISELGATPSEPRVQDNLRTEESFTIRKSDFTDDLATWNAFNPNDTSGTINWDDIVEISVGNEYWKGFQNFKRDHEYEDNRERVEYFAEATNQWGDSWPVFVGAKETQGDLSTIYDQNWQPMGAQASIPTDAAVLSLESVLNDLDVVFLQQFGSVMAKYGNIADIEYYEGAADEPGIIFENGEIIGSVRKEEYWNDSGDRLNWRFDVRDLDDEHILELRGWKEAETPNNAATLKDAPNGVSLREYFYKDDLDATEWDALRAESEITFQGFDWNEVVLLTKVHRYDDYDGDGTTTARLRTEYKFINEVQGRHNWEYFGAEHVDGIIKILDGDHNTIGYQLPANAVQLELDDPSALGSEFSTLVDALVMQLQGHTFQDYEMPNLGEGTFKYLDGGAVIWIPNNTSDEMLVGSLNKSSDHGRIRVDMRFEREDGHSMLEIEARVNVDDNDDPDYSRASFEIREFLYKTDLSDMTQTPIWSMASIYEPTQDMINATKPDETSAPALDWNVIELIELNSYYDYYDGELENFDSAAFNPAGASAVSARYIEGDINNKNLDLFFDWNNDYRLVKAGISDVFMKGNEAISSSINSSIIFSDVVDLDTYASGFSQLAAFTGVYEGFDDPSTSPFEFKLNTDTNDGDLYVFDKSSGDYFARVEDSTQKWQAYGTVKAFEFFSPENDYMGWIWESTPADYVGFDSILHQNTTSKAAALYFSPSDPGLSSEVRMFLQENFTPPFDPYATPIRGINLRLQEVFDDTNNKVGETIFLQFNLEAGGNVRVGYDIVNNKKYTFDVGQWKNPNDTDYVSSMQSIQADSVSTNYIADIDAKVANLVDHITDGQTLPTDFLVMRDPPSSSSSSTSSGSYGGSNIELISADADLYYAAEADILAAEINGLQPALTTQTAPDGKSTFAATADIGSNSYLLEISSDNITDFADLLEDFLDKKIAGVDGQLNTSDDVDIGYTDIAFNVHNFVTGAIIDEGIMGPGLSYDVIFESDNDGIILDLIVEDIQLTMPPSDSLSGSGSQSGSSSGSGSQSGDMSGSSDVVAMASTSGTSVNVTSAMMDMSGTVTGITASSSLDMEAAAILFVEDLFEPEEYDPFIGGV